LLTALLTPPRMRVHTRPCRQSQDVDHEYREPDETGEVLERLFVAGGDSAELFDSADEVFDLISVSVANLVVSFLRCAVFVSFDAGLRLQLPNTGSRFFTVVGGVAQHIFDLPRFERFQQLSPQGAVSVLDRSQDHFHQAALSIDRRVELGIQASA
jgi:hypothetical protein